jgi:hypothetical protein
MKKLITGVFPSREKAQDAIQALYDDLSIGSDEVSYIYRNSENEVKEVNVDEVANETSATQTATEGAAGGAVTGGAIGALAGIATVAGLIPVIGPIFVGGTLLTSLGIGLGAGAVGTTVAAATTGAMAGGLIGALTGLGVPDTQAKEYEDRVAAGDVLVAVHAENHFDVAKTLTAHGALSVDSYTPTV